MSDSVRITRRRLSAHGPAALLAMLVPALAFPIGLLLLQDDDRFNWLARPHDYPWQFWIVGLCGTVATAAGVIDWHIHRSGTTIVGRREHRAHVAALAGGGIPLFLSMAVASLLPRPAQMLIPLLIALIATVILICYDEFLFHRRCRWGEVLAHRILTFGNGLAFLGWAHWCFARGGADA